MKDYPDRFLSYHVHSLDLVDFVFRPETLEPETRELVSLHLSVCPSCREEHAVLSRDLEDEGSRFKPLPYSVAAAAAGGLLLLGLFVGRDKADLGAARKAEAPPAGETLMVTMFADGFEGGDLARWDATGGVSSVAGKSSPRPVE